jgi:hypothetical protein
MAAAREAVRTLRASRRSTPAILSASHSQGFKAGRTHSCKPVRGLEVQVAQPSRRSCRRRRIQIGAWSRGLAACARATGVTKAAFASIWPGTRRRTRTGFARKRWGSFSWGGAGASWSSAGGEAMTRLHYGLASSAPYETVWRPDCDQPSPATSRPVKSKQLLPPSSLRWIAEQRSKCVGGRPLRVPTHTTRPRHRSWARGLPQDTVEPENLLDAHYGAALQMMRCGPSGETGGRVPYQAVLIAQSVRGASHRRGAGRRSSRLPW